MVRDQMRCAALAVLTLTVACSGEHAAEATPPAPSDPPTRIVSLIPAATEILFALDAGERLVGRTRWGVYPPEARDIPDVGDGMRPSLEAILARDPDLVILYDGAANAGLGDRLATLGVASLTLQHDTFADLSESIAGLGRVAGCDEGARRLVAWIERGLEDVARAAGTRPRVRAYYDAWAEPPITIGRGSFLDSLLTLTGADNVFGDLDDPGPRVSLEAILQRDPDWIVTTTRTDSLHARPAVMDRPGWDRLAAIRAGRVAVVDQDLVGRLGPRLAQAARQIAEALHPELSIPRTVPWEPACAG